MHPIHTLAWKKYILGFDWADENRWFSLYLHYNLSQVECL